jgi:hypothetical protein
VVIYEGYVEELMVSYDSVAWSEKELKENKIAGAVLSRHERMISEGINMFGS